MLSRFACLAVLSALPAFCGDWNPRLAADYLDSRQKEWFAWPRANTSGIPCVSCHTGVPYLLVRPLLRKALSEDQSTKYETGLLDGMRKRVEKREPVNAASLGVESVLSALFFAQEDAGGRWRPETVQAFDRMWLLQISEGNDKGAWPWFHLDQDPWEAPESTYFGAGLAAMAVGLAPPEYRKRPDVQEHVAALADYLKREQSAQPLHNRLTLLWASGKVGTLSESARQSIVDEVLTVQRADGGWTIESLGPWKKRENAPPVEGSSPYATAVVAWSLERAGLTMSNPALARALNWLKVRQDPKTGFWPGVSMNRRYEDSMRLNFMQDAATGYASLALLVARQ
jgi:squalene-hopene/tetraprenyl-beta-curcumene cyclase